MTGYEPGEQPVGTTVIKLNINENPYPPSPTALEILRSLDGELLRRYPDSMAGRFHPVGPNEQNVALVNTLAKLLD